VVLGSHRSYTRPAMTRVLPNSFVTLDFVLKDDEGTIIAASADEETGPIEYIQGYGMIVPGLEAAALGLQAGEGKSVVVPAEEGYGEYDEDLVFQADRAELPDPKGVQVGDELVLEADAGEELPVTVVEVNDDTVVVDGNHPLAGINLHYEFTIRAVRAATDKEIADAARELEEAEAEAGMAPEESPDGPQVSVFSLNRDGHKHHH
jgi:FKBP-type peptidyl-prolyl cis-trans isomerase SlyD